MANRLLFLPALALLLTACDRNVELPAPTISISDTIGFRAQRLDQVEQEVDRLLGELTLEEKISLVHANSKFTIPAVERLGIHEMWMSDGPHGVRYEMSRDTWEPAGWTNDQATYLPVLTMVAASWNTDMAHLHGDVLGSEARHRGKDFILGPGVNLARVPTNGRNFEYMGEDPYLAARMAVSAIQGIQKNDVAATIKHYALNSQELNRSAVDTKPDERTLREVYLPAFEAAVTEGKVLGVMGAYNRFRGTSAAQSKHLVQDILKGEWGFEGVLMTDWAADINTYEAAMHGLDIEMGTNVDDYDDYFFGKPLLAMIQDGRVPEAVLDDKVRRILGVQLRIGMMDRHRLSGQRNTIAHQQKAREIAEEGVVLLKNDGILPLNAGRLKKVLVMGPNANRQHALGGGSSEVPALYEITPLQGLREQLGSGVEIMHFRARPDDALMPIPADYVTSRHWTGTPAWFMDIYTDASRQTVRESQTLPNPAFDAANIAVSDDAPQHLRLWGQVKPLQSGEHTLLVSSQGEMTIRIDGKTLQHRNGSTDVARYPVELAGDKEHRVEIDYTGNGHFTLGWDAPGDIYRTEAEYLAAAREADAVIYIGGLDHGFDREAFDRPDMKLPYQQDAVIDKLLTVNPDTIVLLVAGSPVEMPWVDRVRGIVWGWYAGMEAGNVFADVLLGKINPSGKMPFTLPRALTDTAPFALDDYKPAENTYPEGVFIGYRWFDLKQIDPLFPFGHGLSYTAFRYDDFQLSSTTPTADETLTITVALTNTGSRAGAEAVQLYLHDREASVERPVRELKGFGKVRLEPGESGTVSMELKPRDLSFWDVNTNGWLAEPGEFEIQVGASSRDIRLREVFVLGTPPAD